MRKFKTTNIAILCNGEYTPCLLLREKIFHMDSVYEDSIIKLINVDNPEFNQVMSKFDVDKIMECSQCEVKNLCKGGGCRAISFLLSNEIENRNPFYENCYYRK